LARTAGRIQNERDTVCWRSFKHSVRKNSQRADDIQPHEAFEHILRTDPVVVENDGSKLCLACDQRVALFRMMMIDGD
jgi:hypothetical protein